MRLSYIDNIRGYAILLVVLGHVIQYVTNPISFDSDYLFRHIYSFHMPLFFFLSGYVTPLNIQYNNSLLTKLKKRALQLLLPFVIWKILLWVPLRDEPFFYFLYYPDHGLWFLWVLFFVIFIFYFVIATCNRFKISPYVPLIVVYLIMRFLSRYIVTFGFPMISFFFFYFLIGSICGQKKDKLPYYQYRLLFLCLSFILYLFLSNFWYRTSIVVPSDIPYWVQILYKCPFYSEFTAFAGIAFTFLLFSSYRIGGRLFLWLGNSSLGIYAIHQSLLWLLPMHNYAPLLWFRWNVFNVVISFLLVLVVTLCLYYLLSLSRYTKIVFLGKGSS